MVFWKAQLKKCVYLLDSGNFKTIMKKYLMWEQQNDPILSNKANLPFSTSPTLTCSLGRKSRIATFNGPWLTCRRNRRIKPCALLIHLFLGGNLASWAGTVFQKEPKHLCSVVSPDVLECSWSHGWSHGCLLPSICVLDHPQSPLCRSLYHSVRLSWLSSPRSMTAATISVFGLEGCQAVHAGAYIL